MKGNLFFWLLLLLFSNFSVHGQSSLRVSFYNVENLFDIEDNPLTLDEDFTPEGKQQWTEERYQTKLDHINQVMNGLEYPDFIGFSEIENKKVLEDLADYPGMSENHYGVAHYESPDRRGIDVGFLYKKGSLTILHTEYIRIFFPESIEKDYTSRDILQIQGQLPGGDTLYFFVNHWPSRRGGETESEPKRLFVAQHLKAAVNRIQRIQPDAAIIIMGDFNDEPTNHSVASVLGALPANLKALPGLLYNCFSDLDQENKGSYCYRGDWNMLDQIIVSGSLLDQTNELWVAKVGIFSADWLMFQDKKYGPVPNRTYGGTNYYGGFSDHLPVFLDLRIK